MKTISRRGLMSALFGIAGVATTAVAVGARSLGACSLIRGISGAAKIGPSVGLQDLAASGVNTGLDSFPAGSAGYGLSSQGLEQSRMVSVAQPAEYQIFVHDYDTHETTAIPGQHTQIDAIDQLWQRCANRRTVCFARRECEIKHDGENHTVYYRTMYYRREWQTDGGATLTLVVG